MKCYNCNSCDHEPGAKFCHVCGAQLIGQQDSQQVSIRSKVLRCCILFAILVEIVLISIYECQFGPWGAATIGYVNGFVFIIALALSIFANQGHFRDKQNWRKYYEWLHFLVAALAPVFGYLIVSNIQNLWTLILESILLGFVFFVDFGTLEDIMDV